MGIWIDTDMGFDDLAAIMVVRHAGHEIDGISLTYGNAPLEAVVKNAAGAAHSFGWNMPIHAGRSIAVMGGIETASSILGETGIPTIGLTLPKIDTIFANNAFEKLCQWLQTAPSPRRILALGPLGNIAALVLARPDLVPLIDDLTWMGGGLTRGNHTASAEFNAFADPEAVAIVLAHGLPLRMVDLDFCRQILVSPQDVQPVRKAGGRNAALIADMLDGFINIAISRGRPSMALYDPAAAAAFVRLELVSFQPARLEMECAGKSTRGRTVVETRSTHGEFNMYFASGGDFAALKEIVMAALIAEAAK